MAFFDLSWTSMSLPTLPNPWAQFEPAVISFCEARTDGWVAEPANAWSNLAFVVAALVVLWMPGTRSKWLRVNIVCAGMLLGVCSFALHATGTRVGEVADVSSMYMMPALAFSSAFMRRGYVRGVASMLVNVAFWLAPTLLMIALGNNGNVVFTVLIVVVFCMDSWEACKNNDAESRRNLIGTAVCMFSGFGIWLTDKLGVWCDPHNHVFTGHAAWHILTATALVFYAKHLFVTTVEKARPV